MKTSFQTTKSVDISLRKDDINILLISLRRTMLQMLNEGRQYGNVYSAMQLRERLFTDLLDQVNS